MRHINVSDMPKERTIPGYFDDIEAFAGEYFGGKEESVSDNGSPQSAEPPVSETMKGNKSSSKKKRPPSSKDRKIVARAFISNELSVMLGLYKIRIRHLRNTFKSNGAILEEAFCYYIKTHDRETYDEFVTKGLIKK